MDTRSAATTNAFLQRSKSYTRILIGVALGATLGAASVLYAQPDSRFLTVPLRAAAFKSDRAALHQDLLRQHATGDKQALRVRADPRRQRLWVLTVADVYVYDTTSLELIRRIPLPQWSLAAFMCAPAIALDARGAAFVSNNVQPRLLEIDPETFRSREYELTLVSRKQWDVGFGGLAFAPDGSLFAVSALAGALFKIDLANRRANEIALAKPLLDACSE
jgi:hypothetical protein